MRVLAALSAVPLVACSSPTGALPDREPPPATAPPLARSLPHRDALEESEPSSGVIIVDLATGKSRPFATETNGVPPDGEPIGIAADGTIVLVAIDTLTWWTLAGYERAELGGEDGALLVTAMSSAVVTDAGVLVGVSRELAIATPNDAREPSKVAFLGYRIERASAVRSSPQGAVATIGFSAWLLDERVHASARLAGATAVPLDDHLVIARVQPRPPRPGSWVARSGSAMGSGSAGAVRPLAIQATSTIGTSHACRMHRV